MSKIVIIAAMERELAPLVRGWKKSVVAANEKKFTVFEREGVLAVVSGIGCQNAALAAQATVEQFHPSVLMSVGLAGALIRSLKVGSVFTPSVVVDASDGEEYRCAADGTHVSGGVLVTSGEVAGVEAKQNLVHRFHGLVVDMEAAGIARLAQQVHIDFRCVKAISDEADFVMPPMGKFMDAAGNFATSKFALWAALRPWQWTRVAALARNSRRATRALCGWLAKDLARNLPSGEVVTLNRAEFSEAKR
ncbi:MAG: nucleoside phosphorylase [Acidobacteriia bacterium]|nr:nucleoside phosphorylase [Terriglobia bacterium]